MDTNTILEKVQRGEIPRNWHVFHAKKSFSFLQGIVYALLVLLLLIVFFLMYGSSVFALIRLSTNVILLAAIPVAIAVSILVALMEWRQARASVLVITPDGFVQRTGISMRSIIAVSYRDLVEMKLEVVSQTRNGYTCSPVVATHGEATTLRLEMLYPDGRKAIWTPARRFGHTSEIVPYINEGYVRHFAFKKHWNRAKR